MDVDEEAIQRYTVNEAEPSPTQVYKGKNRILRISWPGSTDGRVWEFTDEPAYQRAFYLGVFPCSRAASLWRS